MARMEVLKGRSHLRANLASTSATGSLLEVDAWIASEVKAISPLVDRLMLLIERSHCITGEEYAVELVLREALSNAVVHGNRLDARKLVHNLRLFVGLWAIGRAKSRVEISTLLC